MLRAFVNCAKTVLPALANAMANGVYMTPVFLNFPIAKGGTKTIAHLSIGCQMAIKKQGGALIR
jgi:hypothetical protein